MSRWEPPFTVNKLVDKSKVKAVFVHGRMGKDFFDIEDVKKIAVNTGRHIFHSDLPLRAPWAHYVNIPSLGVEGFMVLLMIDDKM